MKLSILVILLFCSLRLWAASSHEGCLLVKEKTSIFFDKSLSEFIPINKNQILPYLEFNEETKLYKVLYVQKEYWIPKDKVRQGGKHLCSLEPKCFTIRTPSQVFAEPDLKSKVIGDLTRNSQLDWFGQNYITTNKKNSAKKNDEPASSPSNSPLPTPIDSSSDVSVTTGTNNPTVSSGTQSAENIKAQLDTKKKTQDTTERVRWFEIKVGEQYGWVEASIGKLEDNVCNGSLYDREKKWNFDLEYGAENHVSSITYDELITKVDNPADVACLQNPLVTKIELGQGQRYGVHFDYSVLNWLMLRWGLLYEQVKFVMKAKKNPHPDPGQTSCVLIPKNINSLEDKSETITEQNIIMPLGSYLKFNITGQHFLLLGGSFNVINNIAPHFTFNYYKGDTLSKQTLNTLSISPEQIRYNNEYELRYLYKVPITTEYLLGLSLYYRVDATMNSILGLTIHL